MSLTKEEMINSLFVRWTEDGKYQGAFVTKIITIYEDGKLIAKNETAPEDVAISDISSQEAVKKIIGKMQVDQQCEIDCKNKMITELQEETNSLKKERDSLATQVSNLKKNQLVRE